MDDTSSSDTDRAAGPLYGLAALGALGAVLGRPVRPDHAHFWAITITAILVNALIVAVCVYGFIDALHYLLSTTPCQRMGTC